MCFPDSRFRRKSSARYWSQSLPLLSSPGWRTRRRCEQRRRRRSWPWPWSRRLGHRWLDVTDSRLSLLSMLLLLLLLSMLSMLLLLFWCCYVVCCCCCCFVAVVAGVYFGCCLLHLVLAIWYSSNWKFSGRKGWPGRAQRLDAQQWRLHGDPPSHK